jgi:outer membrane protein OmpA-like peptidoglycan-associated protein
MTPGVVPEQSLTDTREEIMPNWTANLGISYNFTPPKPPAPKDGRLRGVVTDAKSGLPLSDVVIVFPGKTVTDLITDDTGRFTSYAFPAGAVEVSARKENYQPGTATAEIVAGREVMLNFQLGPIEQVGGFVGQVTDDKGKPILASLSFEGTNLPNIATDPLSGNFETRMMPDIYTVKAVATGFNPQSKRIRVVDKRTTRVNFELQAIQRFGTLMGKIETADGRPIAGVISFDNPKIRPIASNPDTGQYSDRVEPGTYRVKASASGFEPALTTITLESGSSALANFVLSPVVTSGTLRGRVVDAKSGQGVYAVISSPNGEFSNMVADPESGNFVHRLPAGEYLVRAAAPNFKADQKQVRIENGQTTEVRFDLQSFERISITKEQIQIKEKIRFATGRATILFDSYPLLDEIAQAIKDSSNMQVVIEGHTDSTGGADTNMRLSQQRAEAVRDYLASRGVEAQQLRATGYGQTRPIAPNDTEDGREKNRRVEFNIIAQ